MASGDPRKRNIHSDAPKPDDIGHRQHNAQALAARDDIPYEQRLHTLQKMLAEASGEEAAGARQEIRLALQMLGADIVTDEDQPLEAPQKSGYRPTR